MGMVHGGFRRGILFLFVATIFSAVGPLDSAPASGLSSGTIRSPFGHASYEWRGTSFIAIPERNLVVWTAGDLRTTLHVFRDLPGAHDVWVSPDGILHVWIRHQETVTVRRIELGTGTMLGDVAPETVPHGSHQTCVFTFQDMIVLSGRCEAIPDPFVERVKDFSQAIDFGSGCGWSAIPGGADGVTLDFGAWVPDPESGFLDPPIEEFVFLFAGNAPPVNVSAEGSSFRIPPDSEAIYLWSRSPRGGEGGVRLMGFVSAGAPAAQISMRLGSPVIPSLPDARGGIDIGIQSGNPGNLRIRAVRVANTGGHMDDSHLAYGGNAPPGRDPFIEFAMDPHGPWTEEVTATRNNGGYQLVHIRLGEPEMSGQYVIEALEINNQTCPAHAQVPLWAQITELQLLPEIGNGYISVGGRCRHHGPNDLAGVPDECKSPNDNHWGTRILINLVQSIAANWKSANPSLGRLRINDMSLPYGGKFDVRGDWGVAPDEHYMFLGHADGRAVDIPVTYEGQRFFVPVWRSKGKIREVLHKKLFTPIPLLTAVQSGSHWPGWYIDEGDHFHVMSW